MEHAAAFACDGFVLVRGVVDLAKLEALSKARHWNVNAENGDRAGVVALPKQMIYTQTAADMLPAAGDGTGAGSVSLAVVVGCCRWWCCCRCGHRCCW